VKGGSNTSTVTLRIVEGDKKRSLKYETVKYGHESEGTRTPERLHWRGPAACTKDRPVISSERAPQETIPHLSQCNKYLVMSPSSGSTPRLTD
jgi:hypothetical protein